MRTLANKNFFLVLAAAILLAGLILVLAHAKTRSLAAGKQQTSAGTDCSASNNQELCWQQQMKQTLQSQGLPAAFDILANLYDTAPAFASQCHAFTHELGQEAYEMFASHQDFELNSKTQYCGYGFYHGFMETLLQSTGDVSQAQNFCAYVGKKLAGQTSDGEGACYHGIGHGAVDGTDIKAWGNPQAMIDPSLKLCKFASCDNQQFLYRCVTGVYNALEILSSDPQYKLTMIQKNPFWLCPSQPEFYKEPCYTNMLPSLLRFTNNDLVKSEKMIEKIPEQTAIKTTVSYSLFHEFIRLNLERPNYNIENGVQICHGLADPYRLSCIEGLAGGHMKYGDPQQAYVKGLAFCKMPILKSDEEDSCYNTILTRLPIWYSPAKSAEICSSVDVKFQTYCR